uniref:Ring finger protein 219 n=1 Tax=Iconisemion striatum TaxID=60296 RepID=A0A1A7YSL2_9TELE
MRKCLRKTRGELLLREYEEEIDGLMRENKELKTKTEDLEEQLKTVLHPCSVNTAQPDDKKVSVFFANKSLRSQNVDLVHENMRLKTEVASRSPQKFGRYTVAALESKIQQHERDVEHLKRALERSDQYIDELEAQVKKTEKKQLEVQESFGSSKSGADVLKHEQKVNMMMRSLSDNERMSICSNPEAEFRTFSRNHSLVFMPTAEDKSPNAEQKEDLESTSSDFLPTTPSSAFRSLTLRSPGIRGKKVAFKPVPHLRKLNFEEYPSPSKTEDLNGTLISEPQPCPDASSSCGGKPAVQGEDISQDLGSDMDNTLNSKEAPSGSEDSFSVEGGPRGFDSTEHREPSQTDELSFDLLFDPLDEIKAVPSGSLSPVSQLQDQDHVNSSCSSSSTVCTGSKPVNTTRDRHALNSSQPVKRKSHSPFNTSSPTKLSKLM